MLTCSILFINILYYKTSYIYIYTSRALINESILIRAGSRALVESSLYEFASFNNRV
jgi:hypothetical protein